MAERHLRLDIRKYENPRFDYSRITIAGYLNPEEQMPPLYHTEVELLLNAYEQLQDLAGISQEEKDGIKATYAFADKILPTREQKKRLSDDDIRSHFLAIKILLAIENIFDFDTHRTADVHDLVEDTDLDLPEAAILKAEGKDRELHLRKLEVIRTLFGSVVADRTEMVTNFRTKRLSHMDQEVIDRLEKIWGQDIADLNVDQLEKIATDVKVFIAAATDILGFILKLADAAHNALTVRFHDDPKRIATRLLNTHASGARALGLNFIAQIIEDYSLEILKPEVCQKIFEAQEKFDKYAFRDALISEIELGMHQNGILLGFERIEFPPFGINEVYQRLNSSNPEIGPDALYPRFQIYTRDSSQYRMWLHFFNEWLRPAEMYDYEFIDASVIRRLGYHYQGKDYQIEIELVNGDQELLYKTVPADAYRLGIPEPQQQIAKAKLVQVINDYRFIVQQHLKPEDIGGAVAHESKIRQFLVTTPTGEARFVKEGSTAADFAGTIHPDNLLLLGHHCWIKRKDVFFRADLGEKLETGDIVHIVDQNNKLIYLDKTSSLTPDDYINLPGKWGQTNRTNIKNRIASLLTELRDHPETRKDAEQCGMDILNTVYQKLYQEELEMRPESVEEALQDDGYYDSAAHFLENLGFNLEAREKIDNWLKETVEATDITDSPLSVDFNGTNQADEVHQLARLLNHYRHSRHAIRIQVNNEPGFIDALKLSQAGVDILFGSRFDLSRRAPGPFPTVVDILFLKGDSDQVNQVITQLQQDFPGITFEMIH